MSLAVLFSRAVSGVQAPLVTVETHIANGLPSFTIVGLPDTEVKESKDRVRAALQNAQFKMPAQRITVNLAPADLPKESGRFDLPIALGILAATGQIPGDKLDQYEWAGELALTGELRPIHGALAMTYNASQSGRSFVLPQQNAAEASLVNKATIYAAKSLLQVCAHLSGHEPLPVYRNPPERDSNTQDLTYPDLDEVKGQAHAKRALEIAAAGGHNLIFVGPPGSGKTMLARRLPGILPPMTFDEQIEVSKIHSIAGLLNGRSGLLTQRPFRAPHHTSSSVALVGGGAVPRPGEVSLAHHGILFLDELPEFSRNTLEVLRQPLEDGKVLISRSAQSIEFPSRFLMVAAMNPTPSGFDPEVALQGRNSSAQIQRYLSKISGPLLDRIDIHIEVPAAKIEDLRNREAKETSAQVRERVCAARERQLRRFARRKWIYCNAHMSARDLDHFCHLQPAAQQILETAMKALGLSARAYDRLRKVARTIADLAQSEDIAADHISEAVQYRNLDRWSG